MGDVGQNKWEEIDYLPAGDPGGRNFGWNLMEGSHPYSGEIPQGMELVAPVFEYDHNSGCSVTGGYVYRGQQLPEWQGIYIFGDYCSGNIWGALRQENGNAEIKLLGKTPYHISSFGEDEAGEIYLLDLRGSIYRLEKK